MKIFISYMNDCMPCVNDVEKELVSQGYTVTKREREKLQKNELEDQDIIVVIAGDGTFLKTSHLVDDQPMIGVNATPQRRVGFYCRFTPENIVEKINEWNEGKLKPKKLLRLESQITHGSEVLNPFLALNELYIGCKEPFHVSKYWLTANDNREFQKSSGLIVSTPSGSTAWNSTAGGKKLQMTERKMQFVAREPVRSKIVQMKMTKGIIDDKEAIEVESQMEDGIVIADSVPHPWKLAKGDRIRIKAAEKDLNFIG